MGYIWLTFSSRTTMVLNLPWVTYATSHKTQYLIKLPRKHSTQVATNYHNIVLFQVLTDWLTLIEYTSEGVSCLPHQRTTHSQLRSKHIYFRIQKKIKLKGENQVTVLRYLLIFILRKFYEFTHIFEDHKIETLWIKFKIFFINNNNIITYAENLDGLLEKLFGVHGWKETLLPEYEVPLVHVTRLTDNGRGSGLLILNM